MSLLYKKKKNTPKDPRLVWVSELWGAIRLLVEGTCCLFCVPATLVTAELVSPRQAPEMSSLKMALNA